MSDHRSISRGQFLGVTGAAVGAASFLGTSRARAETSAYKRAVQQAKPYLIGSPYPLHSFYAADGEQMRNGSGLAIDEINATGGIGGKKIERIVIDADVATPEGLATAFTKLINDDVDALIIGYVQVPATEYDLVAAYGAPYLHGNTYESGVQKVRDNPKKYSMIFNVDSTEVWYGRNFPGFLNLLEATGRWKPKKRTVHFIEGDLVYSQTISKSGQEAVEKSGKWKNVGVEKVITPTNDWAPVIRKLHQTNPGVVMNDHPAPADLAAFMKAFAANPTDSLVYLQYGPSIPVFLELAGSAANGAVWSSVLGPYQDVLGRAFKAKYRARHKLTPGANAGQNYDTVYMLARAWAKVGNPKNFKAVSDELRRLIHRGVCGGYWLNHIGQVNWLYPAQTQDPSLGNAHLFYQVQNGQHKIIYPTPYTEAPFTRAPWQSA